MLGLLGSKTLTAVPVLIEYGKDQKEDWFPVAREYSSKLGPRMFAMASQWQLRRCLIYELHLSKIILTGIQIARSEFLFSSESPPKKQSSSLVI